MAMSQSTSLPTFQIPFHKHQFVGKAQNLRILTESPKYPLISSFRTSGSHLREISCVAEEASSPSDSISSVFVKWLPDSVSEGRLTKVFSEFGEVFNGESLSNHHILSPLSSLL